MREKGAPDGLRSAAGQRALAGAAEVSTRGTIVMDEDTDMPCRRARIMIVEDEWTLAMDLAGQLEDAGYEILGPTPHPENAKAIMDCELVDGALLDIALGASSSYPIAEALMQRGIPFAFVSAYTTAALRPDFQKHLLISKPVGRALLVQTVEDLIGGGLSPTAVAEGDEGHISSLL
jgi:CheY-like chemotaxis protein